MLPTKFRFIWPSGFRGENFKKSAHQKQELPMFVDGSGQNEQFLERTFHRCFLPSFTSFGWVVSEEKIKMWKANGRRKTDAKWWQKLTLSLARWAKNTIGEGTKIFWKYQFAVWLSIQNFYSHFTKVTRKWLFWSHCRALWSHNATFFVQHQDMELVS
jgi:hypothetical protein